MTPTTVACSYDVFDTCLARGYASGHDLLTEVARRLVTPGPDVEERIGEVVRLRAEGERRARGDGRDAAPLAQVYACLPELAALGVDSRQMHELEMALERETLRPIASTAARIAEARRQGRRILFVSDMHLPSSLLRECLVRFGMATADDPVYVSGELGVSKATGRLFDHVLAAEGLRPDQVLHHGDDEGSDVLAGRARGLSVEAFLPGRLTRYEHEVLQHGSGAPAQRSRIAGLARLARLGEPSAAPVDRLGATVGADVVGPLFAGFVRWVLDDARERGLQRLLFVSRDGQALHEVAERVRRSDDPECVYVYGSRQAWFLPSFDFDLAGVAKRLPVHATVVDLLELLGVAPEDVRELLSAAGVHEDDPVDRLAPERCSHLELLLREQLGPRVREARDLVQAYARQVGMLDGPAWALVDIGWSLNVQGALRDALQSGPVGAYYLAVRAQRRALQDVGWYRAKIREDYDGGREVLPGGWVFDNGTVVEHVFCRADHGRCTGYERLDGRVVPVLRPFSPLPQWSGPLRAAALRCAELLAEGGVLDDGGAAAFAAGDVAGRLFVAAPTREEAVVFGATPVSDDIKEDRHQAMAPPLGIAEVFRRVQRQRRLSAGSRPEKRHWDAAAVAAAPLPVRAAIRRGRSALPDALRVRSELRGRLLLYRTRRAER